MLPDTEEEAKDEWENGLTFNNNKYVAWFAAGRNSWKSLFYTAYCQ